MNTNIRVSVQSPLMNISILFKTPKQTTKYSIHWFPHSFQINSTSMLFLEQGLRTVDVYVSVHKPQVSPADRVLCCCQWDLAIISYPLSGCLQSQKLISTYKPERCLQKSDKQIICTMFFGLFFSLFIICWTRKCILCFLVILFI